MNALWHHLRAFELRTNGHYTPAISLWSLLLVLLFLPVFFLQGGPVFAALRLLPDTFASLVQPWRLVSDGLLHGDPWQLLWPLVVLGFFAHLVEGRLGTRGLNLLIVAALLAGSLVQLALGPVPLMGFRCAHFALLVAFATIAPQARLIFVPAWILVVILVGIELLYALQPQRGAVPHVLSLTGAALGFACIRWQQVLVAPWRRWRQSVARLQAEHRAQQEAADQAEIDRLLEKVSREGLPSLTAAERRFLDRSGRRRRGA